MTAKAEKERQRQIQEKCQAILAQMLREEDNKYCVDCDAKGPRWASWNLGIFLCIRCAGIHRNLGVHISKVKSVNLDTWTPEQVAYLQQMGNSKARAVYEANLPDNFRRPQTDSSLEAFIRAKYEQKKYIAKEWVQPPMPKPAFDIEEDRKKEKEKKRSRTKGAATVEIPVIQPSALPRPHAVSSNISPTLSKENLERKSPSQKSSEESSLDLLGLDAPSSQTSGDLFDVFLSATSTSSTNISTSASSTTVTSNNVRDSETADFFNQVATADTSKKAMMSKESILSLYGATNTQTQQPVFGIPGGMYVSQQMYVQPVHCVPGVNVPITGVANGVLGMPPQNNTIIQPSISSMPSTNPFLSMENSVSGQDWNQQSTAWNNIPPSGANGVGTNPIMLTHGLGQFQYSNFGNEFFQNGLYMPYHQQTECTYLNQVYMEHDMTKLWLQQQVAALQVSGGQNWNMAVPPGNIRGPTTALNITEQTTSISSWPTGPQGQTLSTNLWQ